MFNNTHMVHTVQTINQKWYTWYTTDTRLKTVIYVLHELWACEKKAHTKLFFDTKIEKKKKFVFYLFIFFKKKSIF